MHEVLSRLQVLREDYLGQNTCTKLNMTTAIAGIAPKETPPINRGRNAIKGFRKSKRFHLPGLVVRLQVAESQLRDWSEA